MKLRKIILTMMASATILGVGTGIGQMTSASARHVHTYRVRRHRTHRHRRFAKRSRKRSKNVKRAKRNKRSRRVKRVKRRKMNRPTRYNRRGKRNYRSPVRRHRRVARLRNMFSEFTPAQLRHMAKLDHEPLNAFKQDAYINSGKHIYGPAKAYNMDAFYMIFTKPGLAYYAKMNKMSVAAILHKEVKHATKYWNWDGSPTKLDIRLSNQDAIKELNKLRESKGIAPVTPDPDLQFIADKRAQQIMYGLEHPSMHEKDSGSVHIDSNGIPYATEIANKYHLEIPMGENICVGGTAGAYTTPEKSGKEENNVWMDAPHIDNRISPSWTRAGINTNDVSVEEFS